MTHDLQTISEKVEDGVVVRRFELAAAGQLVPGIAWRPEDAAGPRPTVLFGHGGFQSKEAPNIVEMAVSLAQERGWASVALDAPGHGERRTEEQVRQQEETLQRLRSGGVDASARRDRDRVAASTSAEGGEPRMVTEWKALLDALEADPATAGGPYGYWGVSMGARFGIPLLAGERRITAAVLGLFGLLPDPAFQAQVAAISQPLLFLFQHDDELMTPESGMALFAAFGSTEKTMHVNPGPHVGIPLFEREASATFLARHLT